MIGSDTSPATIAMYRIDYDDTWSSDSSRYEGAKIGATTCNSIAKELFITRLDTFHRVTCECIEY